VAEWRLDWRQAWQRSWLPAFVVVLLVALGAHSDWMQTLNDKAYDLALRASPSKAPSERVAVIAIDDASIAAIGRWPWSRDIHAQLLDALKRGGAKAVGYGVLFSEPQIDTGITNVNQARLLLAGPSFTRGRGSAAAPFADDLARLNQLLDTAAAKLDGDRKFAAAIAQTANTVLPFNFIFTDPAQKTPSVPLPEFVLASQLKKVDAAGDASATALEWVPAASAATSPLPALGEKASALGFLNFDSDADVNADGIVRAVPLAAQYYGRILPSFVLAVAAKGNDTDIADIEVHAGEGVSAGKLRVSTDRSLRVYPHFYGVQDERAAFVPSSFNDVLSGRVPPERFRNRIVLIGATAPAIASTAATPIAPAMPMVLVAAHTLSSMLQGHSIAVPAWRGAAETATIVLVAVYLLFLLPTLTHARAALVSAVLLLGLVAAQYSLIAMQAMWVRLMAAMVLLLFGYLAVTAARMYARAQTNNYSGAPAADNMRMLGLALQSQDQLDLAFDKFRQVPLDDTMLSPLYKLGLDFERKQQFNKAAGVFEYIAGFAPGYRDVQTRAQRPKALEQTGVLGGPSPSVKIDLVADGAEKTMLGRYQIEKVLGKGSMGVVYLGRDPKISRVVAIKTLELSKEFENEELTQIKERFFREAETAGKLAHPNIVTIFDAGEDQDLAYIAMECLKGRDLNAYTKPGQLLPPAQVLEIGALVADALAYAHAEQVVHRDIKPANIMFEPASNALKVTDFGIARIADSSRTRTGMVLGTPSYMSPEQLAGKKIDGRSDLYSLGVMLYQLLSGHLPFKAESIAELMYKIANEAPPDILRYNPTLPDCVLTILRRALAKLPGQRYQDGARFAAELRACAGRIGNEIIDIGL
jgi:serine/threonine-protein kinase